MFESISIGVAIVIITGIIGTVARHITNSDRHPAKNDIVFRDVCKERHEGVETKINGLEKKVDMMHQFNQSQFEEVKALIRNHGT